MFGFSGCDFVFYGESVLLGTMLEFETEPDGIVVAYIWVFLYCSCEPFSGLLGFGV